jgi:hypothetical protein
MMLDTKKRAAATPIPGKKMTLKYTKKIGKQIE